MTAAAQGLTDMSNSQQAKMNGLPLGSAKWTGGFWGDRFQLFSTTGVWSMWDTWNTPWETLDRLFLKRSAADGPSALYDDSVERYGDPENMSATFVAGGWLAR